MGARPRAIVDSLRGRQGTHDIRGPGSGDSLHLPGGKGGSAAKARMAAQLSPWWSSPTWQASSLCAAGYRAMKAHRWLALARFDMKDAGCVGEIRVLISTGR